MFKDFVNDFLKKMLIPDFIKSIFNLSSLENLKNHFWKAKMYCYVLLMIFLQKKFIFTDVNSYKDHKCQDNRPIDSK